MSALEVLILLSLKLNFLNERTSTYGKNFIFSKKNRMRYFPAVLQEQRMSHDVLYVLNILNQ